MVDKAKLVKLFEEEKELKAQMDELDSKHRRVRELIQKEMEDNQLTNLKISECKRQAILMQGTRKIWKEDALLELPKKTLLKISSPVYSKLKKEVKNPAKYFENEPQEARLVIKAWEPDNV